MLLSWQNFYHRVHVSLFIPAFSLSFCFCCFCCFVWPRVLPSAWKTWLIGVLGWNEISGLEIITKPNETTISFTGSNQTFTWNFNLAHFGGEIKATDSHLCSLEKRRRKYFRLPLGNSYSRIKWKRISENIYRGLNHKAFTVGGRLGPWLCGFPTSERSIKRFFRLWDQVLHWSLP